MTIEVKRGDVGVIFDDTLTANGQPIDLTDATVLFLLRERTDTEPSLSEEATIDEDPQTGRVSYTTAEGDLDVPGVYRQEWEITFSSGDRFTVPSGSYNTVRVVRDLNPES